MTALVFPMLRHAPEDPAHDAVMEALGPSQRAAWIGQPCPYCGHTMTRRGARRASRDHVVPRARGGRLDQPLNRLFVCQACNSDKADQLLSDWHRQLAEAGDARAPRIRELMVCRDAQIELRVMTAALASMRRREREADG
jgi:hypothetical protein